MCETSGSSTSSCGARSIAPATRKSGVVWKTWLRIVWNAKSCAIDAATRRTRNVGQPRISPPPRRTAGMVTPTAAIPVAARNTFARSGRPGLGASKAVLPDTTRLRLRMSRPTQPPVVDPHAEPHAEPQAKLPQALPHALPQAEPHALPHAEPQAAPDADATFASFCHIAVSQAA